MDLHPQCWPIRDSDPSIASSFAISIYLFLFLSKANQLPKAETHLPIYATYIKLDYFPENVNNYDYEYYCNEGRR